MQNYYFDNAATSFPKPDAVAAYMSQYLKEAGGTYGRGAYPRIIESTGALETTRELLADILGVSNPEKVVFTHNATHAINTVLFGLNLHDSHILISPLEHNSVMRPLLEISRRNNLTYEVLPHTSDGFIDVDKIKGYLKPSTKLIIVNHQSNVNGVMQPVRDIKATVGEIPVLVDLAQSMGHSVLAMETWGIDFAAFTGHKGLLGPTGTGGLYIKDPTLLKPLIYGGTGSRSESFGMPLVLPDTFEAGTPNVAGIHGLLGALEHIPEPLHKVSDISGLLNDVKKIKNFRVYCSSDIQTQGPLFSVTHQKYDCGHIAEILYANYKIETRSGLHCAPLAHKTLGTFPTGTVRFAMSAYHTKEDFEYLLEALETISII